MKNLKLILASILMCMSCFSFAQKTKTPDPSIPCSKGQAIAAKRNFENDLKNNTIKLYLQGGIISVINKEDLLFQKDYSIQYKDFGCVAPANISFYEAYNYQVFHYLSEKFGNNWKEKLNINAFGLNKSTAN